MADRTVNIEFRTSGADAAARQIGGIGTAASEAQKKLDGLHATRGRVVDDGRAAGRLRTAEDLDPARGGRSAVDPAGDEGWRWRNPLSRYGLGRIAMPLFMVHAAGAVTEGLGKGLEELAKHETTVGQATDMLTRRMAESIPIIGGLIRGIGDMVEAASGVSAIRAGNERFASIQGRAAALRSGQFGLDLGGATRMAGLGAEADAARLSAEAAGWYGSMLTPEVLASFRPDIRPGEANAQTGPLRQRALQARAEVLAAQATAGSARIGYGQFVGGLGLNQRAAAIAEAQAAADEMRKKLSAAELGVKNAPGFVQSFFEGGGAFFGAVGAGRAIDAAKNRAGLEAAAETARGNLEVAQKRLQQLQDEQHKALEAQAGQRGAVTRAETAAARAQARYERADLEATTGNELELARDMRSRHEQSALGIRSDADARSLLRLAERAMESPLSLTREQEARVRGDPMLREQFEEAKRKRVAELPGFQELERRFGGGRTMDEWEGRTKDLADQYQQRLQEIMQKQNETTADAYQNAFEELGDVIRDAIVRGVDSIRTKLAEDATKDRGAQR